MLAMSDRIFEILIGVPVGILTTIVFLFLFGRILSPRIKFSAKVRVRWLKEKNRYRYSLRIQKTGFFNLIETKIHCRLLIKDVNKNGGRLWDHYSIPTTFSESIVMVNSARYIDLKIHESKLNDPEVHTYVRKHTKQMYPDGHIRFEDIFSTYSDVHVRLYVICLLYTSPSPRDRTRSRMPSSA